MTQTQSMHPDAAPFDDVPLPRSFPTEEALEDYLATPSRDLIRDLAGIEGDLMILGASGKMGPSLARLARNAIPEERRVIAVARFTDASVRLQLENRGIETIACDLQDRGAIAALPRCPNIVFMVGRKFGADSNYPLTWAVNTLVPAFVAESFRSSRIVAFSTACVYPFVPVDRPGATEATTLNPPGEYANSCVGRERDPAVLLAASRHSGPARAAQLCHRPSLRRVGGHSPAGLAQRAGRCDHGLRQRDLAGRREHPRRCAASRQRRCRLRRSISADPSGPRSGAWHTNSRGVSARPR